MQNLIVSLEVVAPLFIYMAIGYVLKLLKIVGKEALKTINAICFKVFLPALLFKNIYDTDLQEAFDLRLTLFCAVATLTVWVVCFLLVPLFQKDNKRRGVMIQGMARSNFVFYGIPVISTLFPEASLGAAAMTMSVVVPMYNVLAVVVLEIFKGEKIKIGKIFLGIVTNPLIIGSLLGILFLYARIPLPKVLSTTVSGLAGVATPLALVALGGTFQFRNARANIRPLSITVLVKLVIFPISVTAVAVWMGFRDMALATIMIMSAAPTAINSYNMAAAADADADLAGEVVIFTTAFSVLSVFLFVYVLKSLGLM